MATVTLAQAVAHVLTGGVAYYTDWPLSLTVQGVSMSCDDQTTGRCLSAWPLDGWVLRPIQGGNST